MLGHMIHDHLYNNRRFATATNLHTGIGVQAGGAPRRPYRLLPCPMAPTSTVDRA